jgi:hypothetical protein
MRKYSQRELLQEGFFDTIKNAGKAVYKGAKTAVTNPGKSIMSGIKTVGRTAKAVGDVVSALDPESAAKIAAPYKVLKGAFKTGYEGAVKVFTDIPKDFQTLETRIDEQEKRYSRKRQGDVKKIDNGFVIQSQKVDPISGRPVGRIVSVIYDKKGNYDKTV